MACVLQLAGVRSWNAKFVILDGSTAEGSDRKHSDYDMVVVRRGLSEPPRSVTSLFGVFEGRIVSGWLVDEESFKHRYIGDDDQEFLWRTRQLRKARLLYGDRKDFGKAIRKALTRRWNKKRQISIIRNSYATMVEYMGKMLDKAPSKRGPEFFQDGYIIGKNVALLVAALNRIDLDSDRSMYRQIFDQAKVRPPNFECDFEFASGLAGAPRDNKDVILASKRLVRWAREKIIESFGPSDADPGFWRVVQGLRL